MLEELPILSLTTFFPLFGALFILLIKGDEVTIARNSRYVALWASVLTFVLSLLIYIGFDPLKPGYQFVENRNWVKEFNISYHVGVDGFSILFILLSTFLMPLCILASWESIQKRVREYMLAFLLLETLMIGMFCALDLVLFYVFFEGVLIPMFLIIGIWGGERRVYSCFKFFLYTFLGSVFMLLAIIAIYMQVGTTDLTAVYSHTFSSNLQHWLWLAFFASFAVKVPMWPVHTWLPDAHVEAPTAGSVILAGVLLKMGGYGFLRFSVPLFPEASLTFAPFVMTLSVIAVIYTSLVALVQKDMKKLIAYSSVAHMGFVTLGIFAMTPQAVTGAMIQMLSHGLISAALFLCVGVVYDRLHTRDISRYGGLVAIMPVYAAFFMLFTMASVGLPGTSGFVGEFLVILGSFQVSTVFATLAATGMILGAAYALWLYRRVVFGKLEHADLQSLKDLNWRERFSFAVLGIVVLWMGIYPKTFTDIINPSVGNLIAHYTSKLTQGQKIVPVASVESAAQVRGS
ncbi:MAG: NADH-quinone oxidoreductase subunit M [Candidatus Paracaedibacteraceae bacterium]|nr:NADH-quinone oxidoreductase subunit M [Candidatus Paracaedibacteraceae bacterium]